METKDWKIPELVAFEKKLTNAQDKAAFADEVKKIGGAIYISCFNFCITRLRVALSENNYQANEDSPNKKDKTYEGKSISEILQEYEKKKRGAEKFIITQSREHKFITNEHKIRLLSMFDIRCQAAHPTEFIVTGTDLQSASETIINVLSHLSTAKEKINSAKENIERDKYSEIKLTNRLVNDGNFLCEEDDVREYAKDHIKHLEKSTCKSFIDKYLASFSSWQKKQLGELEKTKNTLTHPDSYWDEPWDKAAWEKSEEELRKDIKANSLRLGWYIGELLKKFGCKIYSDHEWHTRLAKDYSEVLLYVFSQNTDLFKNIDINTQNYIISTCSSYTLGNIYSEYFFSDQLKLLKTCLTSEQVNLIKNESSTILSD